MIQDSKKHRLANTVFLVVAMAGLLSLLGYLLAGLPGVKLAVMIALITFALTPSLPPGFVMARMGAVPILPGQAQGLYDIVARLSERAGLERMPGLYLLPSRQLNAFAVGDPRDSGIGITRGLFNVLNGREIGGILAHEIAHIRNNDTRVMALSAVFGRVTNVLSFGGQILLVLGLPLVMAGMANVSLLLLLALATAPWLSMLLFQALSRTREFEADLGSAELLNDPEALASALAKVEAFRTGTWKGLFFPYPVNRPDPLLQSHPPTRERIRRLRSLKTPRPAAGPGRRILVL